MDDAQLVARTRRGSREAARQLVLRHWPSIWHVVYGLTGRASLAEEIAQDAFARAFAALDRFDETRPLGPWLRKIALNRAIDELRHERRLALVEPPEGAYEAPLKFKAIARGGASGGVLADRAEVTWVAFAHSTWGGANRAAHIFGLGPAAVKAVNRFDYNHHFVVYVFRRGAPVRVRELRLRRLNRSKLELCVYTRDAAGTPPNNYGFEALWVRKTFGINHVVPLLDSSYPVIFDPRGKLVYPVPIGNVKPGLCRSGG